MSDERKIIPFVPLDIFDPKAYTFTHLAYRPPVSDEIDADANPLEAAWVFCEDKALESHYYEFKENLVLVEKSNKGMIRFVKEENFEFIGAIHYELDIVGNDRDSKEKLEQNINLWRENGLFDPHDRDKFLKQNPSLDDPKP